MSITLSDCRPYVSLALFEVAGEKASLPDCLAIREAVARRLKIATIADKNRKAIVERQVTNAGPVEVHGGATFGAIHVEEERTPGWYTGSGMTDCANHLVVIAVRGKLVALVSSDAGLRDRISGFIVSASRGALQSLRPLSREEMASAFVGSKIRTVWLSATHRSVAVKPDAKVLSGVELEAAFDPLDDQSYAYSSIRTPSLGDSQAVGVNPAGARLWTGPSRNWSEFAAQIGTVFTRLETVRAKPAEAFGTVPVLALPFDGLDKVDAPYDMTAIVPELLAADYPGSGDDPWRAEFADAARFEIQPGAQGTDFTARICWGEQDYGTLRYSFEAGKSSKLKLSVAKVSWHDSLDHADSILGFCTELDHLTVYYDTGHTLSRGAFYETRFRDMPFPYEDWLWAPLHGYDVDAEKPLDGRKLDIAGIGEAEDTSLFGFVARHWPDVETAGSAQGWLLSDDGAMESADFIHLDETSGCLSLIHVKGSSSAKSCRHLSVTDFEVVVGQAVKNLRHLDRHNLHEKLSANAGNKIGKAVWHNGVPQSDRSGFLDALAARSENAERRVVIFQPRARKEELTRVRKKIAKGTGAREDNHVRRLRQLDTLLLAARADCYKLGATFRVVGSRDI